MREMSDRQMDGCAGGPHLMAEALIEPDKGDKANNKQRMSRQRLLEALLKASDGAIHRQWFKPGNTIVKSSVRKCRDSYKVRACTIVVENMCDSQIMLHHKIGIILCGAESRKFVSRIL